MNYKSLRWSSQLILCINYKICLPNKVLLVPINNRTRTTEGII
jgi:hypothetical protein